MIYSEMYQPDISRQHSNNIRAEDGIKIAAFQY